VHGLDAGMGGQEWHPQRVVGVGAHAPGSVRMRGARASSRTARRTAPPEAGWPECARQKPVAVAGHTARHPNITSRARRDTSWSRTTRGRRWANGPADPTDVVWRWSVLSQKTQRAPAPWASAVTRGDVGPPATADWRRLHPPDFVRGRQCAFTAPTFGEIDGSRRPAPRPKGAQSLPCAEVGVARRHHVITGGPAPGTPAAVGRGGGERGRPRTPPSRRATDSLEAFAVGWAVAA